MLTTDYHFELPERLIAQFPTETRGESRLFVLDRASGSFTHDYVVNLARYLPRDSVMVFNDSRVRKSRLLGTSETGAAVEFLLTRRLSDTKWEAITTKMKKRRIGSRYFFPGGVEGVIAEERPETRVVDFSARVTDEWLDANAHLPLPPYIKRDDLPCDADRYQTVYSKSTGSSAAPTAGLHFTEELLASIDAGGVERKFVTLHVGLGTFMPVRSERIEDHRMHAEEYSVSDDTAAAVNKAKAEGRKVIAVGTTSLRTLESAADPETGMVASGERETSIFIYPGYRFKAVDALFTNFHTPESTLLMLVSAFAGKELIFRAYEEAIAREYRFFSYGDAMLIL